MNSVLFQAKRKSKVSLTALIDVVFILLLFFMLTSSFSRWKNIDLKTPVASNAQSSASEPQLLYLDRDGNLTNSMTNKQNYLSNEMLSQTLELETPVIIMPNSQVEAQSLLSAIERVKNLGFTQVTLGQITEH